jgi:hypothetical protein
MVPTPSWKLFEHEIVQLLLDAGFKAQPNAGAARPRQTDVYARGHGLDMLVEAKDRRRAIDVSDIDSLRSRLRRTASDVIGVIFTRSSLSRTAIQEIESDRTREILAFNWEEIEQIRSGETRFLALVERKREELRMQGRAWFRKASDRHHLRIRLPKSTISFKRGTSFEPHVFTRTEFAHAAFALGIPDPGWGVSGGEGARISLRLTINSLDDVRELFGYLHDKFGLSANGSFSAHQSNGSWHGVGIENFLDLAKDPWSRYEKASLERIHHSEDFIYFDQFRNGSLSFCTRLRVPDRQGDLDDYRFHSSELCIQLPGIPVDVSPFLDLCRFTGNDWANFQHVQSRLTHTRRLRTPLKVKVAEVAVQSYDDRNEDKWVVGLVVRNPFYRKKRLPKELEKEDVVPRDLVEFEYLLCSLRDQIEFGDSVDYYLLEGVEFTENAHVQVLRPFGTWNKIVKRIRTRKQLRAKLARDVEDICSALSQSADR